MEPVVRPGPALARADEPANERPSTVVGSDTPFIVQIGERRFTTTQSSLSDGSTYFKAFFSGRWIHRKLADGSYFVDADGDSFEHVLKYMRLKTMPLFWKPSVGFDHDKYLSLQVTAEFFGVAALAEWIENKVYLDVVTVSTTSSIVSGNCDETPALNATTNANTKLSHYPTFRMAKMYVCPRGINVHMGDSRRCGTACKKAQGDSALEFEDVEVLSTLVIRQTTGFDLTLCMG